jgi:enoyl-[acyl-carrier protein] reductase II
MGKINVMEHMANLQALYFGGDMEAAIPLGGQVTGRIDEILTAKQIVDQTMAGFNDTMAKLASTYA